MNLIICYLILGATFISTFQMFTAQNRVLITTYYVNFVNYCYNWLLLYLHAIVENTYGIKH